LIVDGGGSESVDFSQAAAERIAGDSGWRMIEKFDSIMLVW